MGIAFSSALPEETESATHRLMVSVLLRDRNLLFLHVPKTGGGSISRILKNEPDAALYPVRGMSDPVPCVLQLEHQLCRPLHEYRTVAFIRNPWDWVVSGFLHVTQNMPAYMSPPSFRDFVLGDWRGPTILHYPNKFDTPEAYVAYHTQITPWEHLTAGSGSISIDRVCRFENLENEASDAFGITGRLPHANKSERKHYAEYFDDDTRSIIADRHADLIDQFGYQFIRP